MHGFEHAIFARHIMRLGRHGPKRRTSQYAFAIARPEQIRQVRMPARKLLNRDSPLNTLDLSAQVHGERLRIDLFTRTDGSNLGSHQEFERNKSAIARAKTDVC